MRLVDVTTSVLATVARLGYAERAGHSDRGRRSRSSSASFEACPYCRKVREAPTVLDLEAIVYPCPKGGPRFRPDVKRRGGKARFPYLVDPNTGRALFESADIVRYFEETYGAG